MTTSEELFQMTSVCISSLIKSEDNLDLEIIVIESNKNYNTGNFKYPDFVKVIIPDSNFNFHKFLNIGIKASVGEFVALCNNDLIFHKNWFSEIVKISVNHPHIKSFSPSEIFNDKNSERNFEVGYKVQQQIKGWCLVVEHSVFPRINYLDELFDFYYADNDYSMSLMMKNIKHAIVYNSYVEHLEKKSSANILTKNADTEFFNKYKLPEYIFNGNYDWILQNEKGLDGFLKFYSKWGNPNWVYRKNKIAKLLLKYDLGYFVRFMYSPKKNVNIFKDI